jgi:hypothetical protein
VSINLNISYCLGKKTTTNSLDPAISVKPTHTGVGLTDSAENPLSLVARSRRPDPTDPPDPVTRLQSPAGERERERERERSKQGKKRRRKKSDAVQMVLFKPSISYRRFQ